MSRPVLAELSEALGLGPEPEAVLGPLRVFYAQVDAQLSRATEGLELPCRAGCSDCCYEAVFVCAAEFLAVAEAVHSQSRVQRHGVLTAMRRIARTFEDELELLETMTPGRERDEVAARIRFRCPLLDSRERCSVYAVRELNARTFGQSMDGQMGHPYGCSRTHHRLRVLGVPNSRMLDARALREALGRAVETGPVHVYPWWFDRYARYFEG